MNGWDSERGFLIRDKKESLLMYCCHPLSGKTLRVRYAGAYPYLDSKFDYITGDAVLVGGISVEMVTMFGKKFNFTPIFIRTHTHEEAIVEVSQKHYGNVNASTSY